MTGHIIYEFVVFLIWHGRNYAGTRCLRTDLRRCFTTDASLVLKERVSVNSGSASRAPYRSGKSLGISSAIVIRVPITESRADALILALMLNGFSPSLSKTISQTFGKLRSVEHTSELQSLMRNSYAVFC